MADVTPHLVAGEDLPFPLAAQQRWDGPEAVSPVELADGARQWADLAYARLGGFRPLRLDLTVPPGADPTSPVPVVVYVHGGGFVHGSHHGPMFGIAEALVAQGIAVASVQYRLIGESQFPGPLHDVVSAVRWVRGVGREFGLDPDRVGIMGESAGGHLATFAGLHTGDLQLEGVVGVVGPEPVVRAAVGWYPVTDFGRFDGEPFPVASPSAGTESPTAEELARWASPVTHVTARAAPMLLIHGDTDLEVDHGHSEALAALLTDSGVSVELVIVPGAGHVFAGADPAPIVARTVEWLADKLSA
ncbi:alpha/beta hydrolase [Agromyces subbeticus]|uniref:alpha/beta hydrolase n=1 Tax=Agromyces subbeticus TaxID=293890 RepID=UPI00146ECCB0|nr:alpha/beta hydrolase [Agromyces subbeticus]